MEDQYTQAYEDELFGDDSSVQNDEVQDEELGFDETAVNPDDGDHDPEDWTSSSSEPDTEDAMTAYLRARGIDKSRIRTVDENGNAVESDFDDLSEQEKLDILNSAEDSPISDDELATLNYLRQNGVNIQEYTQLIQQQAVEDYLAQSQAQNFQIDDLSDDELFCLDLINRFGDDMSNEEIDAELDSAKIDEELFQKKVDLIRQQYQQQEAARAQQIQNAALAEQQQDFAEFTGSIANAANNLNEIQGVELDPEDKQQIMDFLLTPDAANRTGFSKVLSDPDAIVRLAWFYLYGDQTFNATVDYFKNELSKSRRGNSYAPRTVNRHGQSNKKTPDPYGLNDVFK